jgi:hypothetical protein
MVAQKKPPGPNTYTRLFKELASHSLKTYPEDDAWYQGQVDKYFKQMKDNKVPIDRYIVDTIVSFVYTVTAYSIDRWLCEV